MSKSKINLSVDEIEDIQTLLKVFPDTKTVEISTKRCAGIGTITKVKIPTTVQGITGVFTVEITGVADW